MKDLIKKLDQKIKFLKAHNKSKITLISFSSTARDLYPSLIFTSPRETDHTIGINITVNKPINLKKIFTFIDGKVDYILIDCEAKNRWVRNSLLNASVNVHQSKLVTYKPNDFTVDAIDQFIAVKMPSVNGKKILIAGCGNIGAKLALRLAERGAHVTIAGRNLEKLERIKNGLDEIKNSYSAGVIMHSYLMPDCFFDQDCIVSTASQKIITKHMAEKINYPALILDVGIGTFSKSAIEVLKLKKITLYTGYAMPAYKGYMTTLFETINFVQDLDKMKIRNIPCITPGIFGDKGDVILDNLKKPTKIIGIADGQGGLLLQTSAYLNRINILQKIINKLQ